MLLTIQSIARDTIGVRVFPGFHMRDAEEKPGIKKMIQGCRLELRGPDGSVYETRLVTYGIPVEKDSEENILYRGDIKNAEIRITLPLDVPDHALSADTEVWLLDNDK
ncbi:MAG TPA: hypothetical protein VG269_23465 [Tepidisphaeraceae bacterium]|jgi:hypothetical protein|nr:hypothetical protein [Tepidisphaeraceae bacterium]